jgi:Ni,Fe-hydrogenase III component G
MSINKALDNILEGKLDEMRENFSAALSTKAVEKLEERKIEIAQNYFGQVFESADQLDEKAKWRKTKVAKKITDPEGMDSISYDYHYDNPRSTGMLRATSDKPNPEGSISKRRSSDIASTGKRKGKITKASASKLMSNIVSNKMFNKNKKPRLPKD